MTMYAGDEFYGDEVTSPQAGDRARTPDPVLTQAREYYGTAAEQVIAALTELAEAGSPKRVTAPAEPEPDVAEIESWLEDGVAMATDGCGGVEPDGHCPHGCPSWPLYLGYV